jgi:hypothetical protein
MSKSQVVLQMAIANIKNDDISGLSKILKIMPLNKLRDTNTYYTLLANFLGVCAGYDRPDAVHVILEAWKQTYDDDKIDFLSTLFMVNEIDLPTLSYVVLLHKDFTYVELMDDLIEEDNSPSILSACSKADKIFGPQPYETYKSVKTHADELENWVVSEYVTSNLEEVAPYQEKPKWVRNYTQGELIPESEIYNLDTGDLNIKFGFSSNTEENDRSGLFITLPSNSEIVKLLTEGLSQLGLTTNDEDKMKEYLLSVLETSTDEEKRKLIQPVIDNQIEQKLGGDKWLFQIFGPANPLVNQDLTLPGKSNKYGGCRMFLCDVFDRDEDFDYIADWFTGACETCHLRIKHRWYAVRKPRPHGGYSGCFCSWDCARNSIFENEEEPDILTHELINIFEEQINEIGIQDRL